MNVRVEQWMDKLAIVKKFEKAEDAAQTNRTLSPKDRTNQMRICRDQVLRGREEMDRMLDQMTEEEREEAGQLYERHLIEDRELSVGKLAPLLLSLMATGDLPQR